MLVKYSCQHLKRRIAAEALVLEVRKEEAARVLLLHLIANRV
jgi:hypothetical protein